MNRLRSNLTYANVISTLCLFLVLGGGAWAATSLPKKSVGTPQLKANAVTGAKVKNGSLTGADVDAATLGQVPSAAAAGTATNAGHATSADSAAHADSATRADHATSADSASQAGDATTLDGLGSGAFYAAAGIQRIDASSSRGAPLQTIYTGKGLVLTALCQEGGLAGSTVLQIFAASTATSPRVDAAYVEKTAGTEKAEARERTLESTPLEVWTAGTGAGNFAEVVGTLLYTDAQRTIDITLETRATSSHECFATGTAAESG